MKPANRTTVFWKTVLAAAVLLGFLVSPAAEAQQPRSFSTGAGKDGRAARPGYSLKVVFAQRDGPFLAGVEVVVYDESGAKVVETFSDGPWLFLDLPPGAYRVVARLKGGRGAAGEVKVGGKRQKSLYLTW